MFRQTPLMTVVLSLALAIAVGWLLVVGQSILLPILISVIAVYVIVTATQALERLPLIGRLPEALLLIVVLLLFASILAGIALVVATTIEDISAVAPSYQQNLERLLDGLAARFELETQELWQEIRAATIDQINLRQLILGLLGSFTSIGAAVFLVILYAAFLLAERSGFPGKVRAAFNEGDQAEQVSAFIANINRQIGEYLTVKTTINLILGGLSFLVLWAMEVDFALFWAIVIGLLNYIPYIGSYVGVAMPTLLSLAQFGSGSKTLMLAGFLIAAQVFVGNFLEPKLIGRQMNLSPFVVIVSLIFWSALWGIPGAILAIPLTSVLVIILAGFPNTRPLAILMANRVEPESRR